MDKKQFINSIKEGALKGKEDYGILASLTIARAILESGWGSSKLSQNANNLFGIKAFSDWTGKRITFQTQEWYDSKMVFINSEFRAYDSFNDSIEDHNKLLSYSRYKSVRECTTYNVACLEIYSCGYATDPDYPEKLIKIIEDNRLYEFDYASALEEASVSIDIHKIRKFQQLCNLLNIKDSEGKPLVEDNIFGLRIGSCIDKMPILRMGSTGPLVKFVQEIVNAAPIAGEFGPITKKCVIEYQVGMNLTRDGIVGRNTWTAIVTK